MCDFLEIEIETILCHLIIETVKETKLSNCSLSVHHVSYVQCEDYDSGVGRPQVGLYLRYDSSSW